MHRNASDLLVYHKLDKKFARCQSLSSLLDGVEAAEHEPGVEEHEDVAGGEEADVQVQVGHGHVGKAENILLFNVVIFAINKQTDTPSHQRGVLCWHKKDCICSDRDLD